MQSGSKLSPAKLARRLPRCPLERDYRHRLAVRWILDGHFFSPACRRFRGRSSKLRNWMALVRSGKPLFDQTSPPRPCPSRQHHAEPHRGVWKFFEWVKGCNPPPPLSDDFDADLPERLPVWGIRLQCRTRSRAYIDRASGFARSVPSRRPRRALYVANCHPRARARDHRSSVLLIFFLNGFSTSS